MRRVKEITEVDGELAAVEAAFRALRPGDLVLIQIDAVDQGLELVRRLGNPGTRPDDAAGRAPSGRY